MLIFDGNGFSRYCESEINGLGAHYTQNFEERGRCRPGGLNRDLDRRRKHRCSGHVYGCGMEEDS